MCDVAKLKGKIAEMGISQLELAKAANIDKSTLNRKMKNGEKFTVGEAARIAEKLSLSKDEALAIFFNFTVA